MRKRLSQKYKKNSLILKWRLCNFKSNLKEEKRIIKIRRALKLLQFDFTMLNNDLVMCRSNANGWRFFCGLKWSYTSHTQLSIKRVFSTWGSVRGWRWCMCGEIFLSNIGLPFNPLNLTLNWNHCKSSD
jgi:hypothetical protein